MRNSPPAGRFRLLVRKRPLLAFFTLTYLLELTALIPQVSYKLGLVGMTESVWYITIAVCSPAVAALIVQWLAESNLRICRIYGLWSGLLFGITLGPALIIFSTFIVPALIAVKAPLHSVDWHALLSTSSYHCQYSGQYYLLVVGPILEEPGWRGFALPRLQERFGPVQASLLLGLLWAGWHFPTFLMSDWTAAQIFNYFVVVLGMSVLITFGANLSRFNIVVAIIMHAACNTRGCLLEKLTAHAQESTHSPLIWVVSSLLVPAAIVLATRGRLGARQTTAFVGQD
jgi:membrane protease YdiL (CAAX protease family)